MKLIKKVTGAATLAMAVVGLAAGPALAATPAELEAAKAEVAKFCTINSDSADVTQCMAAKAKLKELQTPKVETPAQKVYTMEETYCHAYLDGKPNPNADVAKCNALKKVPQDVKPAPQDVKPNNSDLVKKYCYIYLDGKPNPNADVAKCNALKKVPQDVKPAPQDVKPNNSDLVKKYCYIYLDGKPNPNADVAKCKLAKKGIDPDKKVDNGKNDKDNKDAKGKAKVMKASAKKMTGKKALAKTGTAASVAGLIGFVVVAAGAASVVVARKRA
ncbi:MAG: hypothetical protein Q4A71_06340 [Actinomycetaceae bacterium]|nr:hypothetical protein [Actinomycetaceae bacterium]